MRIMAVLLLINDKRQVGEKQVGLPNGSWEVPGDLGMEPNNLGYNVQSPPSKTAIFFWGTDLGSLMFSCNSG